MGLALQENTRPIQGQFDFNERTDTITICKLFVLLIEKLIKKYSKNHISAPEIICKRGSIKYADLDLMYLVCWYYCYELGYNYAEIVFLTGRERTTILYGVRTMNSKIRINKMYKEHIEYLTEIFKELTDGLKIDYDIPLIGRTALNNNPSPSSFKHYSINATIEILSGRLELMLANKEISQSIYNRFIEFYNEYTSNTKLLKQKQK